MPEPGQKRNFVGGFQSSADIITTLRYTGNFKQDPRMSDFDFDSDAQLMTISDRHNKQDVDLETLEKQLNTYNIV